MTTHDSNISERVHAMAPLPREGLAVLSCYLDDSDNDNGPVIVLGGIIMRQEVLVQFEQEVEEYLSAKGIEILHAIDFHRTKGPFLGYSRADKEKFVAELFSIAGRSVAISIVSSVSKKYFQGEVRVWQGMQNMSPIGLAFAKILSAVKYKLARRPELMPLTVLVETGHKNNGNLERYFHYLKGESEFASDLSSLSFIGKRDCRSIQVADFVAFHGRRVAENWDQEGYPESLPESGVMRIIADKSMAHYERSFSRETDLRGFKPRFPESGETQPGLFYRPDKKGV